MTTLPEFILARLTEREATAGHYHRLLCLRTDYDADPPDDCTCGHPARIRAEVTALRKIVELHQSWPVLISTAPEVEQVSSDLDTVAYRMTQRIQWATEEEYRARFGAEPPTAPMLRAIATIWGDHPDYQQEWTL